MSLLLLSSATTLPVTPRLTATLQLQGVIAVDIPGPITVYQGDTASFLLTVLQDDGQPFDLATATAIEFRVKPADGAPDPPTILKALGSGVVVSLATPATGTAIIALGTGDTAISPARYRVDVVVVAPNLRQHVIAPQDFVLAAVV
ncbi:MAG: hypothetical protein V4479_07510 [Actinomycetota bacterium]